MKIETEKLEKLLIANWTQFIDARQLFSFVEENIKTSMKESMCKVNSLTITRFELSNNGFIIWLDFKANSKSILGTIEALLSHSGEIYHIRTVFS